MTDPPVATPGTGAGAVWLQRLASARAPRDDLAEPRRRQIDGDWAGTAELWTELGCPYEVAMGLLDATDEQALREALTIFSGLGASAPARASPGRRCAACASVRFRADRGPRPVRIHSGSPSASVRFST